MRKKGIFGGTFDPIHEGHLAVARAAARYAALDEVIFVPCGRPPHKNPSSLADALDRANMASLAVYGDAGRRVSFCEIERPGISYTIETLGSLQKEGDELYVILGGDAFEHLSSWRQVEELKHLARVLVVPREARDTESLSGRIAALARHLSVSIELTAPSGSDVSSSEIRARLQQGDWPGALPPAVAEYISCHALYGMPFGAMSVQLRRSMSESRFRHTLSVAQCAVALAELHGVSPIKAHLAGMLHDCAKGMDAQTLRQMIREGGISADEQELGMPALLHAPAGVYLARKQYHVTDAEVLSAIRWHTTGRRNMTRLEKVIYLADAIESGRPSYPGLDDIRALARTDLDAAVRLSAARTAAFVASRGKKLHSRTAELKKPNE